jgi:hypothetical protein
MSIVFRCPECDHKLRASTSAVGKQSKCKCGALVVVPDVTGEAEPDDDEAVRGAWRLQPKFSAGSGDLCEAITAWSPLCAPRSSSPTVERASPTACLQRIVVGTVGILTVSLIVAGLLYAFRPRTPQAELDSPVQQAAIVPADKNVDPPDTGSKEKQKDPSTRHSESNAAKASEKENTKENVKPVAKGVDSPKEPATDKQPMKPEPVEQKVEPKRPPIDPSMVEIIEWRTYVKLDAVNETGGKVTLEVGEKGAQAGLIIVTIKARVPAKALTGKKFVPLGQDVTLGVPSVNDPFPAEGYAIDDGKLWYAPEMGERAYIPARDGVNIESWLFVAPLKDLESGRTTFQIKDQRAVLLTPETRRGQAP